MNNKKLTAVAVAMILVVFAFALARSVQNDPVNKYADYPESYAAVLQLTETDTKKFSDVVIDEDDAEVRIEPKLEQEAADICSEFTCIAVIESYADGRYTAMEGFEINLTSANTDAFVLPDGVSVQRPFRIKVQVLDERAKVISSFYSSDFN